MRCKEEKMHLKQLHAVLSDNNNNNEKECYVLETVLIYMPGLHQPFTLYFNTVREVVLVIPIL